MKKKFFVLMIVIPFSLFGCGTVMTIADKRPECSETYKPNLVYSGVKADWKYRDKFEALSLFDMPFSFVADTVILPYTIMASKC